MVIDFQIEYKTWYGQQLLIVGSLPELGSGSEEKGVAMQYTPVNGGQWRFRLEIRDSLPFSYRYVIRNDHDGSIFREGGKYRHYEPRPNERGLVVLSDRWRCMGDAEHLFTSSAFTRVIFRPEEKFSTPTAVLSGRRKRVLVRFFPLAARVLPGQQVVVCGSSPALGSWDIQKGVKAGNEEFPVWSCEVAVPVADFPLSYKYVVLNHQSETSGWEEGPNRVITFQGEETPGVIEVRDEHFSFPEPPWRGAGVAVPVFSLRSEKGWGTGEFNDLKLLTDWAVATGIRLIQILPVNDTVATHTWHDSYPYAAISVFALHPVYVNLLKIGKLNSEITRRIINARGEYLDSLDSMDYEGVMTLKSRFFKLIYDQQKGEFLKNPDFMLFFEENEEWLKPYAAFCWLRDLFHTPDFSRWGRFAQFSPELLQEITDPRAPHYDDIAIHYFIQYHAHCQLSEAAGYARKRGVVLKGDIPIGIYRFSVDAWVNPLLFHMDEQAGAPADDFSATGQNWRFPTYNWKVMGSDHYRWWQQRLRQMSVYFDAFRIDHILGFFRIWQIPSDQVQGVMGHFYPAIAFRREEILARGITFDEKRFCQPYIRDYFLGELFGEFTAEVKSRFLEEYAPGCYFLKPDVADQMKIEALLTPSPDESTERKSYLSQLKQGLFTLVGEVLFLEAPDSSGKGWFPRNMFHLTRSYQDLDPETRNLLDELYIDFYFRRNEELWRENGLLKLPVIKQATDMLLCGEDLGMVPACVPEVMRDLGILSLEIQRMPKDQGVEFGRTEQYPYLSVATPSSHDTSTIRGWWEEDRLLTRRYYSEVLERSGEPPVSAPPELVREIISRHLSSPSIWSVFPIQDLLGMSERLRHKDVNAERINQPANPDHYWRYRLHLPLEQLIRDDQFNLMVREMIKAASRDG